MPKTMPQPDGRWQTFSRIEPKLHVDGRIVSILRLFCLILFLAQQVAPLGLGGV
jgi:hypothetical protein